MQRASDVWSERAALLATAAPTVYAALGAGMSMGLFDAPELAAAGVGLGVTHPPGHPLWVALASAASLLPFGTVPYRIALLGAACLGVMGRCVYAVARRLSGVALDPRGDDVAGGRRASMLALAASLAATLGPAALRQTSRVEVYALAGALGAMLLAVAGDRSRSLHERARWSVLLLALGGANHHFIALTTAPAGIWAVAAAMRATWRGGAGRGMQSLRALASWAVMGALGLFPYVLLPLRAEAPASLVRVRTAGDFVWTVTARAFQKNIAAGAPGNFSTHLLDVLEVVGGSLTPIGLVCALAGLLFAARRADDDGDGPRADALRCGLVALTGATARALAGFVANNPDAAGYLVPTVLACAALGASFTGHAWRAIRESPPAPEGPTASSRAVLTALLVALPSLTPVWLLVAGREATAVDRGYAAEVIAEQALASLPPRAVALAYAPETAFRLRYAALVDGERPDVARVEVPFVPYPGMTDTLLARDARLLPLVRDFLAHGEPRPDELAGLSLRRPVRVEVDPHNVLATLPYLVPRGALAEVRGEPTTLATVRATSNAHFALADALEAALARETGSDTDPKIAEYVLWRSYNDTLFFAARGLRPEARNALQRALQRSPQSSELLGLQALLNAPGDGPVDVRPYVVGAPR